MYQNLKLEKGLYHLTNKSFVQALEALDPSAQYADTPLAGLDAYERQLKRFDIRISGAQCDRVEKFFTSTESAVLFPEFVRRAVQQGIDASMLSDLTAVETHTDSSQYLGCTITETDAYGTVAQGAAMTSSTILEATTALTLNKYGRLVKASYEAVRRQRLDVFAVLLKSVGMQLGQALMQQAITTLTSTVGSTTAKAGSALAYSDLATLYGKFIRLAEMPASEKSPVRRQWAWMRCCQDQMLWIGQHRYLALCRSSPQHVYNRSVLGIHSLDDCICKLFPAMSLMGICLMCTYCKYCV